MSDADDRTDRRAPVAVRPAATVLLVRDDPFELLMVRRSAGAFFGDALVFPGGTVDPDDFADAWTPLLTGADGLDAAGRALRIAGLRETFEEAAILIAQDMAGRSVTPGPDCTTTSFRELVRTSGGRLPLDALVPFGHWITPEGSPKRWDTHFFLARAPEGQAGLCDGGETVAIEWVRPREMLDRIAAGEASLIFPTRLNLARLAESDTVDAAIAAARARPVVTVQPRLERRPNGLALVIPEAAGYGETVSFEPNESWPKG